MRGKRFALSLMPCAWPVQSLESSCKMSSITCADDLKVMVQFASNFEISYQPFLLLKTDKTRMTQNAQHMTTLASNTSFKRASPTLCTSQAKL